MHEDSSTLPQERSIWMRGLLMFVFAVLFGLAEALLIAITIIQFFWVVFTKAPNVALRDFGLMLGEWLREVARFQSFASETAPFPWGEWPASK